MNKFPLSTVLPPRTLFYQFFFCFALKRFRAFQKFLRLVRATAQLWLNFMCREKRDASEWPVYAEKSNATLNRAIKARRVEKRLLEATKKKKNYCSCWNCSSLTKESTTKANSTALLKPFADVSVGAWRHKRIFQLSTCFHECVLVVNLQTIMLLNNEAVWARCFAYFPLFRL